MAELANYIKFKRGTPTAFNNLAQKDSDTLYFIYEEDEAVGQLWIGDRLITPSTTDEGLVNKLSELLDVDISLVQDGQYLSYNATSGKWMPVTPSAASEMVGADGVNAGQSGLVPAPAAGDNNKYLRGDGIWVELDSYTKAQIDALISGINSLQRKKVDSIEAINPEAEDAEQFIYLVPNGNEENNQYLEYIVIEGKVERIGSIGTASGEVNIINAVNPGEFVISTDGSRTLSLLEVPAQKITGLENNSTFNILQTEVGTLTTELSSVKERVSDIEGTILELQASTTWGTI